MVPPVWPAPVPAHPAGEVRARWEVGAGAALVVTVARLHPQKGLDVLLAAADRLHRERFDLRWLLIGEGPLEAELRARIARLHLAGVVSLAGGRPSAADELAAADVVVIPSRWESGPLVALEALQLGRPLVSTPVGAVPRLVVDGVSGRLVPVGDPAALAAAVGAVLGDPSAARALGEAGRRALAARYDEAALVSAVEGLYREVQARPLAGEDGGPCDQGW